MPYHWSPAPNPEDGESLRLWPHQSLPKAGFVGFIGATAVLISVPLFALLGTVALWVLLPFLLAAVSALWLALSRSYRDNAIVEQLVLSPTLLHLTRTGPRNRHREWQTNPHWVRLTLHRTGGPVPNYVTLAAAGREIEIGAFLSEDERTALHADLAERLSRLR